MRNKKYLAVLSAISILFLVYFIWDNHKDLKNMESYSEMCDLVDSQREEYSEIIEQWENSYSELQAEYGELMQEKYSLEQQLGNETLPEYSYTKEEIDLLMRCVQAEAGNYNDHAKAQEYITQVILNRVKSPDFPNTITEVVYQKVGSTPQFSVAYNGMIDSVELETGTKSSVYKVLVFGGDLPDYVLFFYSTSVKENWVCNLNTYDTVQGTVFAYK
jgi:spore germination cell wall hydrolase CwlJ-like protein